MPICPLRAATLLSALPPRALAGIPSGLHLRSLMSTSTILLLFVAAAFRHLLGSQYATIHRPQESFVKTLAPPDTADVQARLLPAVARPFLLVSYSKDDVLGVIDGDSFLA